MAGDVWTWVALCSDTKLVPSWRIGDRSAATGMDFVADLKSRLEHRVQVTSDGNNAYLEAVDAAFGQDLDYAMLVKRYQGDRYRGSDKLPLAGNPDPAAISTSHVERQNLTMRVSMPRFTRKTNAFSKRVEMLHHATALHFFHYNFCRLHQTVKVTPAMEAGVTDRLFGIGDIVRMVEARDPKPGPRGPYRKCAAYSN